MGQTASGIPWPEPSAPVRDGAAAMRAMAEVIEPRAPMKMTAVRGGMSTTSGGYFDLTIPFTAASAVAITEANGYSCARSVVADGYVRFTVFDTQTRVVVPNTFFLVNVIAYGS